MPNTELVIAVDLGGTKVAVAAIGRSGVIHWRQKALVTRASVAECARQIANMVGACAESIAAPTKITAIGLIVPGIYRPDTGYVWAPNLWGQKEVPFQRELERVLKYPLVMDNDRAGSVLGEQWRGAARGFKDVVFLAVGTGIGAGILIGGKLVHGTGGVAGAVGWFRFAGPDQDVNNQVSCWEMEAAGPALARHAGTNSAEEAFEAADSGDERALAAIKTTAKYLALGVANLISTLNPEIVVLGGGLMQRGSRFLDPVRQKVLEWAQPVAAQQVRIELTQLGEDAGLLGAAWLAWQHVHS
jgi:glucokinase